VEPETGMQLAIISIRTRMVVAFGETVTFWLIYRNVCSSGMLDANLTSEGFNFFHTSLKDFMPKLIPVRVVSRLLKCHCGPGV
jgi:hypothetical protein